MDKSREIPPNAASKESVAAVMKRISEMGLEFHDAVERAGLSRPTGFRLKSGKASVATLRKLEDWVVREETKRGPRAKSDPVGEWASLGRYLAELDPQKFDRILAGVRKVVDAEKTTNDVLLQMFRPTPDFDK